MMSSLRRFGALAGVAALALGLSACTDLTSTTATSSAGVAATEIDYSACATDDSADQSANVDRTGTGNFPAVSGEDTPVIAAGKGAEPTNKVLVKTLKQGDGTLVCPGAKVKVNYVGALWNGTVFDSSYQKGQPIEFSLAQVVKGWGYGLAHAHVGDRVELVIPASLGYGAQGNPSIPPNSTLVFVVDILGASTQNPAGITVTGGPGAEPTLTIDESVTPPTEKKTYTIYKGAGEELTADQSVLYKFTLGAFGANGQTQSSWSQPAPIEASVARVELAGYTVGSRIVIVEPDQNAPAQSGASAGVSVAVVDIVGTASMQ